MDCKPFPIPAGTAGYRHVTCGGKAVMAITKDYKVHVWGHDTGPLATVPSEIAGK
jgi:hypothetical protein